MKRSDVTYGQLDKVLRSFGFTCRPTKNGPPGYIYEHKRTGAIVMLPVFPENEKVYPHHLATVRIELDNFGIADPSVFATELQKTG
jgi:hypothetical protein